ncbi:hypothetical protein [Acinetobacter portensis]|uniref:hypothetical protein n=1 Tax=Acinetobacter portensis TaxID=1839785 RepID=UPI0013D0B9C0|nr:hypothetical protein [Acinetobacter portensis]
MKCYFNLEAQELRINEKLHDDDVEISFDEHQNILNALNSGCIILPDLTATSPRPTAHHNWDGGNWIDQRTEEEKLAYKRSQYPKLTRYQFMRGLLEMGFNSSDIEAQILLIEDEFTRELTMLGFRDAGYFDRNDQSIGVMRDMLGKADMEIDEFWELCMVF